MARSSTEVEYRPMALTTCEITWLTPLLKDLRPKNIPPTVLVWSLKFAEGGGGECLPLYLKIFFRANIKWKVYNITI